ncbi:MAG: cell division protein FtsW [Thermosediminibacterales bacterium]|nr:cell division protein FtsW [Thermosediminibacterales bacterium]
MVSPNKKSPDFVLIMTVSILLGIGIVMVFSSSAVWAFYKHKDSLYFLKRQMAWCMIGLFAMVIMMNFSYWKLKRYSKLVLFGTLFLLIIVLIPGIGIELNYARRWIGVGSITVQPSEIAKMGIILFLASSLSKRQSEIKHLITGIGPYLLILGIVCSLILKQPDLSTSVVIAATAIIMIFTAGARITHMIMIGIASTLLGIYFILSEDYRLERFISFMNPWADAKDTGYHIIQSLYALGSGGILGLGLGKSRQKFFYLPEPQTDFIFSILGEELGFIGGFIVIFLFIIFIWRGFKIALRAPDLFGCLLAMGITTMIGLQAIINLAVVTASIPVTGIPLPFISFGGSSLVLTLAGVGILLNISKYTV